MDVKEINQKIKDTEEKQLSILDSIENIQFKIDSVYRGGGLIDTSADYYKTNELMNEIQLLNKEKSKQESNLKRNRTRLKKLKEDLCLAKKQTN